MSKKFSFNEIRKAEHHNKPIIITCLISGKSIDPYAIPHIVKLTCSRKGYKCKGCEIDEQEVKLVIDSGDEDILKFINIDSLRIPKIIRTIYNIKCSSLACEIIGVQNIERIFISSLPGTERSKDMNMHVAYYIGYGLDANIPYEMSGYTTIDPTNQTVTHVFTKAEKIKTDIDSFTINKVTHDELQVFCVSPSSVETIYERLDVLYNFYAHNITGIYERFDLHLAVDLVFKSVVSFSFGNEFVHNGRLDVMIIGDTRCGKGKTVEGLFKYFGVGEVISADNASFAGLVGGIDKINEHWVVRWGKFPMNDLGIIAIDEASEIRKEDWTRLSRIRSEGVAEVTKIQARLTNARVRPIFISNPPKKIIGNYPYGIQALVDVVETPEDIARFDYCLVVSHDEVSIEDINTPKPQIAQLYSTELEHKLIMWVWSRKHEEIKFSIDAEKLLYEKAVKLASIFDFSIPLIQGENVRIKLAKIAVAFAGRVYSNQRNGQILYVTSVHVECAYYFLMMIYRKDVSGYLTYSQIRKSSEKTDFSKVDSYFDSFVKSGGGMVVKKCLLLTTNIVISDLMEHLNLPREIAIELISKLLKYGCVVKKYNHYVKTPAFNVYLKKEIMNG